MPAKRINGVNYHFEVVGVGKPLLMLHGFTGAVENWQPLVSLLGGERQLILVDILGHGQSDAPADLTRYQMPQVASDIIALVDWLETGKSDLLGYSMGGRLGIYLACHFRARFDRIVIESSSPGLATAKERAERQRRDDALALRIETEGITSFVDFWEGLGLWQSQAALPDEVKSRQRAQRLRNRPVGLANSLRGMGTGVQPSLWEALGGVNRPVLLINGELDKKYIEINRQMLPLLTDGQIKTLHGVGHNTHLERPAEFARLVDEFLKSMSAK